MQATLEKESIYEKYIKRALDLLLSIIALTVLLPLMIILTVTGTIAMKGNPFFAQPRPGKNEVIFKLYKFRTMTDERDCNGDLLPDRVRLGGYGKLLRACALDELPELINIVKGDMSLVGPRPLLIEYLPYYSEHERHRHDVRPGLTGLAQVSGRNAVEWSARFALDVEYVQNISFINDLRIILRTVKTVISRDGVAEDTRKAEGNFAEIRRNELEKTL